MKLLGIFKKRASGSDATKSKQDYSQAEVQRAIAKAFLEMQKKGVDRLVISVQSITDGEAKEGEKKKDASTFYSKYYAVESLQAIERRCLDGKTGVNYQAVALVAPGVSRSEGESYPEGEGCFIEIVNRESVFVFSLVNPDRISNAWGNYPESILGVFCSLNQESRGIRASQVLEAVENGIPEYGQITMGLLQASGVFEAVERLGARKFANKADELLAEARAAISASQ